MECLMDTYEKKPLYKWQFNEYFTTSPLFLVVLSILDYFTRNKQ